MWENPLFQVGAAGAFGVLSLREVLRFARWLIERRNGVLVRGDNPGSGVVVCPLLDDGRFETLRVQVAQMHEWHDTDDPETGMKRWLLMPQMLAELKGIRESINVLAEKIKM